MLYYNDVVISVRKLIQSVNWKGRHHILNDILGKCRFKEEHWNNWSTANWFHKHRSYYWRFRSCKYDFSLLILFIYHLTLIRTWSATCAKPIESYRNTFSHYGMNIERNWYEVNPIVIFLVRIILTRQRSST